MTNVLLWVAECLFPWCCKSTAICTLQMKVRNDHGVKARCRKKKNKKRQRNRGGGEVCERQTGLQGGGFDIRNNNRDYNTHSPPPFLLLRFPKDILPLVSVPFSSSSLLLFLLSKSSGGGPLIASLISNVRQLCGFTGDVKLLQIIACLLPFSLPPSSLYPPFTVPPPPPPPSQLPHLSLSVTLPWFND